MSDSSEQPSRPARYEVDWNPRNYLQQYYSAGVSEDELANARFVSEQLRKLGRTFGSFLEFGCGPTLHHLINVVPYVENIVMADYLSENLEEVRKWLRGDSEAFCWDPWLKGMIEAESGPTFPADPEARRRSALIKRLVRRVSRADIRCADPLGTGESFDLIGSWYCLECIGASRDEWVRYLRNLISRLRAGGVLLLGALCNTREYHVLGRVFEVTPVGEKDFRVVLPELGCPTESIVTEVVPVPQFAEQGFESICCVRAIMG